MPIPREQFDKELNRQQYEVIQFLERAPDKAFSAVEIGQAIGIVITEPFSDYLKMLALSMTLQGLVQKGLTESKTLGGITYYALAQSSGKR